MTYARMWHLRSALMGAMIDVECSINKNAAWPNESLGPAADELVAYVLSCSFYQMGNRLLQVRPTPALYLGLNALFVPHRVSWERHLRVIMQLAKLLRRIKAGEPMSDTRKDWVLDALICLHGWALAEDSHYRRRRFAA